MAKKKHETKKGLSLYGKLSIWLLGAVTVIVGGVMLSRQPSEAADVVVFKSPTCGCCNNWVDHLKASGYSVTVRNQRDLSPVKAQMGVPHSMESCHTATVGGYVIEGHVPADVIARLLKEKPAIKGLAVPGMPMGSPGMEGPRKDNYDILTFDDRGKTTVFASR